jgi:hypothetical protein
VFGALASILLAIAFVTPLDQLSALVELHEHDDLEVCAYDRSAGRMLSEGFVIVGGSSPSG